MRPLVLALVAILTPSAWAEVLVFVDGTEMVVQSYKVQGVLVVVTTEDGKLRSLPLSYVDLEATERRNRVAPPPPPGQPVLETAPRPQAPEPLRAEEPKGEPPPPAPPGRAPTPAPRARSPIWSNPELKVSLVIPSSSWQARDMANSFDVAVSMEKPESEARATLGLVRERVREYRDFMSVVNGIRSAVAGSAGFTPLEEGALDVGPYSAYGIRFQKSTGSLQTYNQMIAFYSRDLVYVLSLSCPQSRAEENEADFTALVHGLVIDKPQSQLVLKGSPQN